MVRLRCLINRPLADNNSNKASQRRTVPPNFYLPFGYFLLDPVIQFTATHFGVIFTQCFDQVDHLGFVANLSLLTLPILIIRLTAKTNRIAEATILLTAKYEE